MLDLNFNIGKVGDSSYLGDYAYSKDSDFDSKISLGRTLVGKQRFLRLWRFKAVAARKTNENNVRNG